MPKSRRKVVTSKDVNIQNFSIPLLDSIRAQIKLPNEQTNYSELDINKISVSEVDWPYDIEDWSDKKASKTESDIFPQSLRSIERKNEQANDKLLQCTQKVIGVNKNESEKKQQKDDSTMKTISTDINLFKLSSIVTDLITGKCDESAYADFLSILQRFSVHNLRDDHLEETVYHLIQAAVSFIRSNEQRFDQSKLQECYRQRSIMKMKST